MDNDLTSAPQGQWIGPMKVVTQENPQTVWCTRSGRLYRCSPEQVRPVSTFESHQIPKDERFSNPDDSIGHQLREVQRQNNQEQFQDLTTPPNSSIDIPESANGEGVNSEPPVSGNANTGNEASPPSEPGSVLEPDNEPGATSEAPDNPPPARDSPCAGE